MARGSIDILLRKNSKLESFLRRTLSEDTYERIRAYESCIVVSEKENKAFKYVVLGDEWIYLTENPPKAVQESVCLRDLISVELVPDHPAFLSGEERENTQHLALTYWKTEKRRRRRSRRSPRHGSLSDLQGDPRSNTSTPTSLVSGQESLSEDYGYLTQSLSSLQVSRPNSRGSLASNRDTKTGSISKKKKKNLNDSLDENLLKSLKEEIEEDCLEGIEEDDRLSHSTPNSQSLRLMNSVRVKPSKKDLPAARRALANISSSDLGGSVNGLSPLGETGDQPEKRKAVINIYLLNLHSPMLMLIRSSWTNYLFTSTLMMNPSFDKSSKTNIRTSGSQTQRDKMELLFSQLKQELFNPDNNMEDIFSLLLELKSATEKTLALKRLFWRSADIFLFLVGQLRRHLPRSPVNVNTEHGREQRADEFEFVIILIEIMSLMFRESEIIPTRSTTLKAERGKAVFDLLMVLTCSPEVPEKYVTPSQRTSQQLGKSEAKKPATDEEFAKLVLDLTKVSLMAVYELFLVARQASMPSIAYRVTA